jgi:hypothetical protein
VLRDRAIAGERSLFATFIGRFWKRSFGALLAGGGGRTSHDYVLQGKGRRDRKRFHDWKDRPGRVLESDQVVGIRR